MNLFFSVIGIGRTNEWARCTAYSPEPRRAAVFAPARDSFKFEKVIDPFFELTPRSKKVNMVRGFGFTLASSLRGLQHAPRLEKRARATRALASSPRHRPRSTAPRTLSSDLMSCHRSKEFNQVRTS